MNTNELDLDALFPELRTAKVEHSMSIDEINEVLDLTLREIKDTPVVNEFTNQPPTKKRKTNKSIDFESRENNILSFSTSNNNIPPTPESTVSDQSRINSPLFSGLDSKTSSNNNLSSNSNFNDYNSLKQKYDELLKKYNNLENKFNNQSVSLDKSIKELKSSELKRLKLVQENNKLKQTCANLILS